MTDSHLKKPSGHDGHHNDHHHSHKSGESCDHDHGPSHGNGHGHGHAHGHHHHGAVKNIKIAFFLNLSFSLIELVGGLYIGSLAIVADAVHDFGDSISLGGAWFLERFANKTKDRKFNFGYRRFSLLSALISGVVISVGSLLIAIESLRRFSQPEAPAAMGMIYLALVGLAVNGFAAWNMSRGNTQNEKVLTWHLLEDVLGWAAVLVGGVIIRFTGWTWVDPLLAIVLSLLVMFNVLRYLKETLYLFLQGTPANFNAEKFLKEARSVSGVDRVDHLAVWSLDGEKSVLSARLHLHNVEDREAIERVKTEVRAFAAAQGATATLETCLSADGAHEFHHGDS
jgi:cobalt-zinc-cadmium efflux system protein